MKPFLLKKFKGVAALDSLMALALLGSILTCWITFNQINHNRKMAKKLAAETITYARIYAKYMNDNYNSLRSTAQSGTAIVLSPSSIGNKWNTDLDKSNLLRQIPCVSIVANKKTGYLEAVLYYVGGKAIFSDKYALIMRQALVILGGEGGLFFNGMVRGNSGWSVDSTSGFLANSNQCASGGLANNSLAINMDLLPEWNRDTMPSTAIAKETDGAGTNDGIRKMPGHMLNANTSKANITLFSNNGVIIDNGDENNPIKLKMGYAEGTNTATIGLYSNKQNANTKTLADTLEPIQTGVAGDSCELQEVGKIIADRGNSVTAQYLNRSTLICSQNSMMCGSVNSNSTCYLPTEANRIIFANSLKGIQSGSGNFVCPKETPFASNVISSSGSDIGTARLQGDLSGYIVTIGYYVTTPNIVITQVTCSNMPDYEINDIPQTL